MNYLTYHFGYLYALVIKDSLDDIGGIMLGMLILIWVGADFILHIRYSPSLDPEIAITKFRSPEGRAYYMINPKTRGHAIGAFMGYLLLFFAKEGKLKVRTVKYWTVIIGTLMILVFLLGIFLSLWHYLPDGNGNKVPSPSGIMQLFTP
jgi:hypothetical protein